MVKATEYFLLIGLFLVGMGNPAAAQGTSSTSASDSKQYWWATGGVGTGWAGVAQMATVGIPITKRAFIGGRFITSTSSLTGPRFSMWNAGPLAGLVRQGRYGQVSLLSGIVMGVERHGYERPIRPPDCPASCQDTEFEIETENTSTVRTGIPVNAQFFLTPIRYVGMGLETGLTLMYPGSEPHFDLSLHFIVRMPR
jgi:hypothetical protein